MLRSIVSSLATAFVGLLFICVAHACNVPNTNMNAGQNEFAFVEGCNVPMVALNQLAPNKNPTFLSGLTTPVTTDGHAGLGIMRNDGSFPLGGGYGAEQIYEWAIGPGNVAAPSWDGWRGVSVQPNGSSVLDVNGIAGYVINQNPRSGSAQVSSGLKGIAVCAANNASCWGIATIVSDSLGTSDPNLPYTGEAIFHEFDYNVRNSGTTVGYLIGGTWQQQPTSATGPTVLKPLGTGTWQYAFGTADGCCTTGFHLGASATSGANHNSQNIDMKFFDGAGIEQTTTLVATPGGIQIASTNMNGASIAIGGNGSVINVPTNGGIQVNGQTIVSADSGATAFLCSGAGTLGCNIGQSSAVVFVRGIAELPKYTVATLMAAYTCNASNEGMLAAVTDANSVTFNTALVGGGRNHMMAYCNGTSWVVH